MADLAEVNRQFCRRPETPRESICLSCFRTIRATKSEPLDDAEDTHSRVCPNGMRLPRTFAVR
jgi:hypothetical protein